MAGGRLSTEGAQEMQKGEGGYKVHGGGRIFQEFHTQEVYDW
jgi:hypothetical protein